MLNPFPGLLVFGFFAPTLLRVTVGLMFGYLAVAHFSHRPNMNQAIAWLLILVETLIALSLFFGYHLQYGAIAGIIVAAGQAVTAKRHAHVTPLLTLEYVLLIVLCLSLLLSGAGALAFDLPL
ncbi:MAG TPA: hypothetical protein VIY48_08755 [Candidatus Paceibacterota bacterium]